MYLPHKSNSPYFAAADSFSGFIDGGVITEQGKPAKLVAGQRHLCGRWPYCSNMSGVMGELHSPPSNIHTTSNDLFYLREQRPVVSC